MKLIVQLSVNDILTFRLIDADGDNPSDILKEMKTIGGYRLNEIEVSINGKFVGVADLYITRRGKLFVSARFETRPALQSRRFANEIMDYSVLTVDRKRVDYIRELIHSRA